MAQMDWLPEGVSVFTARTLDGRTFDYSTHARTLQEITDQARASAAGLGITAPVTEVLAAGGVQVWRA